MCLLIQKNCVFSDFLWNSKVFERAESGNWNQPIFHLLKGAPE